mmetsp:Transcript_25238/g.55957  ORF Transcript_25238/g.55957 Transcript_25238/m.55957 type:complete len:202 (-) Transcript_25238:38-643(-)
MGPSVEAACTQNTHTAAPAAFTSSLFCSIKSCSLLKKSITSWGVIDAGMAPPLAQVTRTFRSTRDALGTTAATTLASPISNTSSLCSSGGTPPLSSNQRLHDALRAMLPSLSSKTISYIPSKKAIKSSIRRHSCSTAPEAGVILTSLMPDYSRSIAVSCAAPRTTPSQISRISDLFSEMLNLLGISDLRNLCCSTEMTAAL